MKVKVEQIIDAIPALAVFAQKELPAKASYRVAKLVRKMTNEHRDYEKARSDAISKYGEKVQVKVQGVDQEGFKVKPENQEAFAAEMRALLDTEVELEGCATIAWADVENLAIAPAVLADLEPFIEAPKD